MPSIHFSRPSHHARTARSLSQRRDNDLQGTLGRPFSASTTQSTRGRKGGRRGGRVDAQADMPLDEPRAQVAFKNSMIHGILQFTLRIAFRCVLHRCKSQDIRC
ncbi:hypothetical protein KP509_27G071100 [Ceratopteris richardii]|uniref:Uncharacterized protein n=1 Tax=Ceratopteris richardii TaxID=49495 RepID=A0A8T2RHE9_CERRI|nr:hypothetical protein KP509_27G071100 [Ceratopteris richardii]